MGNFISLGLSGAVSANNQADPSYKAPVSTPAGLPAGQTIGETRGVVDIGNGNSGVAVWDGSVWRLDGGADRFLIIAGTDYGSNLGGRRVRPVGASATQRFGFDVPANFGSLVSAIFTTIVSATPTGGTVTALVEYGDHAAGEVRDLNTEGPTVVTTIGVLANDVLIDIPLDAVLTGIAPGDSVGIQITHGGLGGTLNYQNLVIRYTPDRAV